MNKLVLSILAALVVEVSTSQAQKLDFSNIVSAEKGDAELYLKRYIGPFMKGFGYGLANGWNNSADAHERFAIDITATGNLAFVPDRDLLLEAAGYQTLSATGGDRLPTIFGPPATASLAYSTTREVSYMDPQTQQQVVTEGTIRGEFEAPDGLDLKEKIGASFVPVPMAQVGIGLIKRTDVSVRWMPRVTADDFELGMWGVGVKHEIAQWVSGFARLPFDASAFAGYTSLSAETDFTKARGGLEGKSQIARYDVRSLTLQMLASKSWSVFAVYGSLGVDSMSSRLRMDGEYIVRGTIPVRGENVTAVAVLIDPIDISFASSGPRTTVGARFQLYGIRLHIDYTLQEYDTLTAGLGLNIR